MKNLLAVALLLALAVPAAAQKNKTNDVPAPAPAVKTVEQPVKVSAETQLALVQVAQDVDRLQKDAQSLQALFNDIQARINEDTNKVKAITTQAVKNAGLNPDENQVNLATMEIEKVKKAEAPKPAETPKQ